MVQTAAGTALSNIIRSVGATDYDVTSGAPGTTKLARFRLENGRPIALQINNKTPRLWITADHEAGRLAALGKREHYEVGRGRHHHLNQIREFKGQPLIKVTVSSIDWPLIKQTISAIGARA